jgi:hypothetical protein
MSEFSCDICGKSFDTKQKVAVHRASHRDEVKSRKERIPVGVKRPNLQAKNQEGKVRRWVNDDHGRLQRFQDGGYEFVEDPNAAESTDTGTRRSKIVDKRTGKRAYLMEIDKELYDEDQVLKQGRVDRVDKAIQEGTYENKLGGAGYNAGIKYQPKDT